MSIRNVRAQAPQAEPQSDLRCIAHGCPCRGTVDANNSGKALCSFHHAAGDAKDWPRISETLRDQFWLLEFQTDLMRKTELWADRRFREYAAAFWKDADPSMVPVPGESRENYVYRLHLEMQHRVGNLANRPEPRVPTYGKPSGLIRPDLAAALTKAAERRMAA